MITLQRRHTAEEDRDEDIKGDWDSRDERLRAEGSR